jgi:hypothetical protein
MCAAFAGVKHKQSAVALAADFMTPLKLRFRNPDGELHNDLGITARPELDGELSPGLNVAPNIVPPPE